MGGTVSPALVGLLCSAAVAVAAAYGLVVVAGLAAAPASLPARHRHPGYDVRSCPLIRRRRRRRPILFAAERR